MEEKIYWRHGCKVTIRKIVTYQGVSRYRKGKREVRYSVKVTSGPYTTVDSALRMGVAIGRAEMMTRDSLRKFSLYRASPNY